MSRLRSILIAATVAAVLSLIVPGSGLARFDASGAVAVTKRVSIPLPSIGDVTFARITITAKTRLRQNPKLAVVDAASLAEDVRVFGSVKAKNSRRRSFEALVIVVSPAENGGPARPARHLALDVAPLQIQVAARTVTVSSETFANIIGYDTLAEVCARLSPPGIMRQLAGADVPDITGATFGKNLCTWGPAVEFVRGPLPSDGAVGVDHLGPSSLLLGWYRTAAGALVHWSSSAGGGDMSYRALRFFGEDFTADPTSQACLSVPIGTYGSKSFTWESRLYGQVGTLTKSLVVGPAEVPLGACLATGDITSVEAFGCFGSGGRGYIGKTIHGAPGTTFHVELKGTPGMFGGTDTALGTGTIPASGELYTGTRVELRGLIDVTITDAGSALLTFTVDTRTELEPAPEEVEPVCDEM